MRHPDDLAPGATAEQSATKAAASPERASQWLWALAGCICGLMLAGAAIVGTYVRLAGDDWIAASDVKIGGVFGPARAFYDHSNGRLSNGLLSGVVFSHGAAGERLLPTVIIGVLVVSLLAVSGMTFRSAGTALPRPAQLVGVLVIVTLYLLAGPNTYQVLFWGSGSITHTVPTVAAVVLLAAVMWLDIYPSPTRRLIAGFLVAVFGLFLGSVSEPFVAVAGLYGLVAVGLVWRRSTPRRRAILAYLMIWLASLAAGFAILYVSPGRANRQSRDLHQARLLSPAGVGDVAHQTWYVWAWLLRQPAYLAALALGVVVGVVLARRGVAPFPVRWLVAAVAVAVAASALVVVGLRAGYGHNAARVDFGRAWENFLLPWLLSVVFVGVGLGMAVAQRRVVQLGAAVVAAASLLALIPGEVSVSRMVVHRAAGWDRQDRAMVHAAAHGARVFGYTPQPSQPGISEPFRYYEPEKDWPAQRIAVYYGFDAIVPSIPWLQSMTSYWYRYYWRTRSSLMDPRLYRQFVRAGLNPAPR